MLSQIKRSVEAEIARFAGAFEKPPLNALPEQHRAVIENFVQRKGKRIRSILFVCGYRAYGRKNARYLYRSAASLELLHDFILIHDDLIDHATLRRGGAAMHTSLEAQLRNGTKRRFKGSDLALVVGDMLYAMALQAFLAIDEAPGRKQKALDQLTRTALYTGCGELDELLKTLRPLSEITPEEIYRIYDWKTGYYTFTAPLMMGATLGGASTREVERLESIGTKLGRAFQLRDDLLDLYGDGDRFGKSALIDLREGKQTLPVWYAYHHASTRKRKILQDVLLKTRATKPELREAAKIVKEAGGTRHAERKMATFVKQALLELDETRMRPPFKDLVKVLVQEHVEAPVPT